MSVTFIGAGPGDAKLLTLKGYEIMQQCDCCLYAGSLVPDAMLQYLPPHAQAIDTASLTLPAIIERMEQYHKDGKKIVRLHSGDCSIYGAIGEQMAALDARSIPYEIIPGVPAFAAAAASLKKELTAPHVTQSVILTRTDGSASAMPPRESLAHFAHSRASLVIHLSIRRIKAIVRDLTPFYGDDAPCAVIYHASREDELILQSPLKDIAALVRQHKITRTALIIVSPVLSDAPASNSALYDPAHRHIFRPQ